MRLGQLRQSRRARRGCAALELDAVLLHGGKVDDRVDPIPGDAKLERQFDVAVPDKVDERGHRRLPGGRSDTLIDAAAVSDRNRAALAQPWMVALAGRASRGPDCGRGGRGRARHLPRDLRRLRRQVCRLDDVRLSRE